jgi:Putative DNA-binding domain
MVLARRRLKVEIKMPLTGLQTREITESILRGLVAAQVPEGKTIDYKRELPGNADSAKKDFLADLCSFANAAGGHIVYGLSEVDGIPTELVGIASDVDQAILRLDSMARDGIRPPILGLEFRRVVLENGNSAIVACVPKSWNPPHQVIFQKDFRFYTRGSAGKQHIEVSELRQIVLLSQEIGERIRQFRAARVAAVMNGDTPIDLEPGARQVLHFIPLSAFGTGASVNLQPLLARRELLINAMNRGGSQRYNIDGLLAFSPTAQGNDAYAQLFRNGILEIAIRLGEWNPHGKLVLPSLAFEEDTFAQTKAALAALDLLSVSRPVAMMISFTGVRGWQMGIRDPYGTRGGKGGFDRDPLLVPELILQSLEVESVPKLIKPLIDAVWNAAGYARSDYYDEKGDWIGEGRRST